MRHLMRVVVESNDGFSLLDARQDDHQSGVGHHQVQVVPGQVKVHRLLENTITGLILVQWSFFILKGTNLKISAYDIKVDLAGVNGVQQLTHVVLWMKMESNSSVTAFKSELLQNVLSPTLNSMTSTKVK